MVHAKGHLREAFHALLEDNPDWYDGIWHADPMPWEQLLESLTNCSDIMPREYCELLGLPQGSTYAKGVGVYLAASEAVATTRPPSFTERLRERRSEAIDKLSQPSLASEDEASGDGRVDAVATPATVEARVRIGPVRVVLRGYYSGHLLWTAQHQAELAGQIEAAHAASESRFSIEHRGYVLSSIIASVAFLEAMVNELYQDAADGHASYVGSLPTECRRLMADLWRVGEAERLGAIAKCEMLLSLVGASLDRGDQIYENAKLAIAVRNTIVHYRPEDRSSDFAAHAMEKRLRGRFSDNALMAGSGNPWWPDHALGHGAAVWVNRSIKALADHVSDAIGIEPNYRRQETGGWPQPPGARELG
jgi:hypothetical protein